MTDRAALRELWLQVWSDRLAALEAIESCLDGPEPQWLPRVWTTDVGFAVADPQLGADGVWMLDIGVVPEERRRGFGQGLARALKARGIAWARASGVVRIRTDNYSRNARMLSINDRVGFVRERGLWSLERTSV